MLAQSTKDTMKNYIYLNPKNYEQLLALGFKNIVKVPYVKLARVFWDQKQQRFRPIK